METLQITVENAKKAYDAGCDDVKEVLSNLFGTKTFVPEKITDRVKTISDIYAISGTVLERRIDETDDEFAYRQLKLIAQVYNEGKQLDPGNTSQYKYFPWFLIVKDSSRPSGFGLSCNGDGFWRSRSDVGVRLCFATSELAIDAGKKFINIYENYLIR